MPRHFLAISAVVLVLALFCAGSAAAVSVTFEGGVLRYRAEPEEAAEVGLYVQSVPSLDPRDAPDSYLQVLSSPPVEIAIGCTADRADEGRARRTLRCPLGSLVPGRVRYRLSFGGRAQSQTVRTDDRVSADLIGSGVIYAGAGNDVVREGDRVYGGSGRDDVEGVHVDGGSGADHVWGDVAAYLGGRPVELRGGPGDDILDGPGLETPIFGHGHLYGGRGDDVLNARAIPPSREMLVGGPGNDVVHLYADGRRDVVRVRGGGIDRIDCGRRAATRGRIVRRPPRPPQPQLQGRGGAVYRTPPLPLSMTRPRLVPSRLPAALVVVLALALLGASSAEAVSITFDGEVLRYRAQSREASDVVVRLRASAEPPSLQIRAVNALTFNLGRGCQTASSDPSHLVHCPVDSRQSEPRYRLNIGGTSVRVAGNLRGVVYAGAGEDSVFEADRVYGGLGPDLLTGNRVFGGPGTDRLSGSTVASDPVVYGGRDSDSLLSPGRLYGGPGSDYLEEFHRPRYG